MTQVNRLYVFFFNEEQGMFVAVVVLVTVEKATCIYFTKLSHHLRLFSGRHVEMVSAGSITKTLGT